MKRKQLFIGLGWLATLALAFVIGQSSGSRSAGAVDPSDRIPRQTADSPLGESADVASLSQADAEAVRDQTLRAAATAEATETALAPEVTSRLVVAFNELRADPTNAEAWQRLMAETALASPAEAVILLGEIEQLPVGGRRDRAMLNLIERVAMTDPETAIAYVAAIPSANLREEAYENAIEGWASATPSEAMEWVVAQKANLSLRDYGRWYVAALEGQAQSDLAGAFNALAAADDTIADVRIREHAAEELVERVVAQGSVAEAQRYIDILPDGPERRHAYEELAGELGRYDPQAGLGLLAQFKGEPAYNEMQSDFVRNWASNDPAAAANWIDQNARGTEAYNRLVTSTVARWSRYDLAGAAEWVNNKEPSPELDRAVAMVTYRTASEDPAVAMTWAESIKNDGYRGRLMERVAGEWQARDPEAFEAYLSASELSDERKERLRNSKPINYHRWRRWH